MCPIDKKTGLPTIWYNRTKARQVVYPLHHSLCCAVIVLRSAFVMSLSTKILHFFIGGPEFQFMYSFQPEPTLRIPNIVGRHVLIFLWFCCVGCLSLYNSDATGITSGVAKCARALEESSGATRSMSGLLCRASRLHLQNRCTVAPPLCTIRRACFKSKSLCTGVVERESETTP